MTAGLGSEYRYFGKLVLVPFRYFSIDTYRNIDIFDNTTMCPIIVFEISITTELLLYYYNSFIINSIVKHRSCSLKSL